VLQCVAVCCSVLQGVAGCCRVLQCVAVRCSALQSTTRTERRSCKNKFNSLKIQAFMFADSLSS